MDESTIVIIAIVVAAVLLIGLAVWALRRRQAAHDAESQRYEQERRVKAREHRDLAAVADAEARHAEVEADARAVQARQAEVDADARAVQARQEQLRAEEARFEAESAREEARTVGREADELDPDLDTSGQEYDRAESDTARHEDTGRDGVPAHQGGDAPSGPRKGPAPRT